jgi:hypothetical protein
VGSYLAEEVIRTGVDDLLDLLKKVEKIPVMDAAKKLGINTELMQSWVDFLVEEEIVGIEYKFTKPIIYLNKPSKAKEATVQEEPTEKLEAYKKEFTKRAAERNIPKEKVSFFWRNHVKEVLGRKKDFFFRETKKRNIPNIEQVWSMYQDKLLTSESQLKAELLMKPQ